MSTTQNTPCGCRCNSADDTREKELPDLRAAFLAALANPDGDGRSYEEPTRVSFAADLDPAGFAAVQALLNALAEGRNVHVITDRDLVRAISDFEAHCSSPVVAETEAVTSDAPAMTVQEGGGSDAAPGVGWATVVRTMPRFVVLGVLVYDRDANKAVSCTNSSAAQSVAAELNANHGNHNLFYWEDAK